VKKRVRRDVSVFAKMRLTSTAKTAGTGNREQGTGKERRASGPNGGNRDSGFGIRKRQTAGIGIRDSDNGEGGEPAGGGSIMPQGFSRILLVLSEWAAQNHPGVGV